MAYQHTEVPIARPQEGIKKLLRAHGAFSFVAVSQDDPTGASGGIGGFEAQIMLGGRSLSHPRHGHRAEVLQPAWTHLAGLSGRDRLAEGRTTGTTPRNASGGSCTTT
jgi:hypothetical protein